MRRLQMMICLVFTVSFALFIGYQVKEKMMADDTPPVITCEEDTVSVSVKDGEAALLKGVTAKDDKDGDLTEYIRISAMTHFINSRRNVTYVVFDEANNIGTLERSVEYTDYVSPKIYMKKPFRFTASEEIEQAIREGLSAEDCLDGDLNSQIRTIWDDSYYSSLTGDYPVTLQVSNSAGDVCQVEIEMTVTEANDREENGKEYPLLSDYIVYTKVNQMIDPESLIIGIEKNGTEYLYEEDEEFLAGTREAIRIDSKVDYANPGVYTVEYSYTGENASTAVTKLFVVVEEE